MKNDIDNEMFTEYKSDRKAFAAWRLEGVEHAIDRVLHSSESSIRALTGQDVSDVLSQLQEKRDKILAEREESRPREKQSWSESPRSERRPHARSVTSGLSSFFGAISCNPIAEESVFIEPIEYGVDFGQTSSGSYSQFLYTDSGNTFDATAIFYDFALADANNDPFNTDSNEVFVGVWWRFQLPERAFDVNYSLSARMGASFTANAFSNNFLKRVQWLAWISGYMHLEIPPNIGIPVAPEEPMQLAFDSDGEPYGVGRKPLWASAPQPSSMRNDYFSETGILMQRSIDVAGRDQPPGVVVAFPMTFAVDGGRLEVSGGAEFVTDSTPPERAGSATLECTITKL